MARSSSCWNKCSPSSPRSGGVLHELAGEAVELVWCLCLTAVAVAAVGRWAFCPDLLPRLAGACSGAGDGDSGALYRSRSKVLLDPVAGRWIWWRRTPSGVEDRRILGEHHRQPLLVLRLRDGCRLRNTFGDFPSASNKVKPALGRAATAARRRHGLEVEEGGCLKVFVVISLFVRVLCAVCCFL